MKFCPRCQKTYADDNLNFCLEDGSVLNQMTGQAPPTVAMNEPRPTQPAPHDHLQATPASPWTPPGVNSTPQKKSSKAWVWVLLIFGGLILVCGGGFVAILAYIGSQANNADYDVSNSRSTPGSNTSSNTASNTTSSVPGSSRNKVEKVDLEPWVKEFSAYGNTEFVNGEFVMSSKQKSFYYVLVATDEYKTDDADTRVTLRNIDNASGTLGYGLIFHSDPTPLQKDYAFLIDTKRQKYKVVYHTPQKEQSVISWTSSDAIKAGSAENTIEVRDTGEKIDLYINGKMVNSIKDVYGYAGGVPGLYTGDAVKVAFKDLEVRK
jgi:hypothetical protein